MVEQLTSTWEIVLWHSGMHLLIVKTIQVKGVESAREIIDATEQLNVELEPLKLPPINVGIGINTGDCIVGNMGRNF